MYLRKLALTNFRNYRHMELAFPPGVTVLHGTNEQGKTNLLEAIFFLATGRAIHTDDDSELIHRTSSGESMPFARVAAEVEKANHEHVFLEVELEATTEKYPVVSAHINKHVKINGIDKLSADLPGHLLVILLSPKELDLVIAGSSARRRHLDTTLVQIDPQYSQNLLEYNRVLEQRNALLRDSWNRTLKPDELRIWDVKLVETGAYLIAQRARIVGMYNRLIPALHKRLPADLEHLRLEYESPVPFVAKSESLELTADLLKTGQTQLARELEQAHERELALGRTLIGPHLDDLRFYLNGVEVTENASRGQVRLAVLSLTLAERELLRVETGEEPILLVDGMITELVKSDRRALADLLEGSEQVIVTCTALDDVQEVLKPAQIWLLAGGQIEVQ